jgi:SanA protein
MARWLVEHGVPAAAIVRDPAGYRTRTTMAHAHALGIRDAVVCTQEFHLPRSVLWARHEGIDPIGLVADQRWNDHQKLARTREAFARTVALFEMWID